MRRPAARSYGAGQTTTRGASDGEHSACTERSTDRNEERITFLRIVVLLLALAVGISIPVEVLLVTRDGGKTVVQAQQTSAGSTAGMAGMTASGAAATPSFAGAAPENADALAAAHKPYDAALPPLQAGDVVKVHLILKDITVQIAPGVKYAAWAWAGGAPGPVIHVRRVRRSRSH